MAHRISNWSPTTLLLGLLLGLLLPLTLWWQYLLWPHVTDDAYFTFRYINNLLAGQGLVFNTGERLEMFSNPLWLFLLAGCKVAFGGDLVNWARGLGLALSVATLASLWWLCAGLPTSIRRDVRLLTLVWCLITPGLQVYASLGLEVPLLGALLAFGTAATAAAQWQQRPSLLVLAAISFGLAGITRPEGLLYGAFWGLALTTVTLRQSGVKAHALLRLAGLGCLTLFPSLIYLLFRLDYYGLPLPFTAYAKPPGIFNYGLYYLLIETLGSCLIPILLAMGTLVLIDPAPADPKITRYRLLLWPIILAGLVFALYAGSDWMLFSRFLLPVFPLLALAMSIPLLNRLHSSHWPASLSLLPLSLFITLLVTFNAVAVVLYIEPTGAKSPMRGIAQQEAGAWIDQTFADPVLVISDTSGGLGYYAPRAEERDLFGLNDRDQLHYLLTRGRYFESIMPHADSPLMRRRPHLVVILGTLDQPYITQPPFNETIAPAYSCAKRFYDGPNQKGTLLTFDVWVRNDTYQPTMGHCFPSP